MHHFGVEAIRNGIEKVHSRTLDSDGELNEFGEFMAYYADNVDFLGFVCPWVDLAKMEFHEAYELGTLAWDIAFGIPLPPPPPPKQMKLL